MAGPRPHLDPGPGGHIIVPPSDPDEEARAAATRFEAAIAEPVRGREGDAPTLTTLREAPIAGLGRIVYSSNAVFLLQLDADDPSVPGEPMRAIYKPRRGERPLWDFPRESLHLREVACYLLDCSLGFDLVPPTTLREGPFGPGSVQLFVHESADAEIGRPALEARLADVAALDALANNADRKSAHLLIDAAARLWAIDNALTFLPYPRQRTVLLELGGTALPAPCAEAVTALAGDAGRLATLGEWLGGLLDAAEVDAALARLRELADDPVYPRLDPWDGRPWEGW